MRATVLGAGSWGTALASLLAGKGFPVTLWGRDRSTLEAISGARENPRYLKGIQLSQGIATEADLGRSLAGAELVVIAVPAQGNRQVMAQAAPHLAPGPPLVSVAKGIEVGSLMTMQEVLEDALPQALHPYLAFLCGPSFASEVARKMPTAVTVASRWPRIAELLQEAFQTPFLRPYTSADVVGCEIGGAVKNVIAIAAGISEGMGFGANALAALVTRGLSEITRLAVAKGGNPLTLAGLAGMGDLILTCGNGLSRNRTVGYGLGTGKRLEEIQRELGQVAEGVETARSVRDLAARLKVEMPICDAVYRVLYEGVAPRSAVVELMSRDVKGELS
jgi:glycerol-3-phosphate dehydrogenase (NAD(P)+)